MGIFGKYFGWTLPVYLNNNLITAIYFWLLAFSKSQKLIAKSANMKNIETVDEYMTKLKHHLKAEVEALRSIILNANSKIAERVKWNSPSFYYKKDLAAFNLRAVGFVHIVFVFYNGDMIHESGGLLEGDYKDRRMAKFYSMEDIISKKTLLEKVVNDWLALIDKQD